MLTSALQKRWVLYLAIACFVIAKVPQLKCQFYWDESMVYAPAAILMYEHGPSLLPGAIDVEYSRGHPLLFHAIFAAWMRVFGTSHFSMHVCALMISILLVICLFEVLFKLYNSRVAYIGTALLLLNVMFFADSAFVLTDIMLTLFSLLSLYAYTREKYWLTAVFLAMLFFTKESGLVIIGVFGLDILISIIKRKSSLKDVAYKSLSVIAPTVLMLLFFIVQKRVYGWYLYPTHTSLIHFDVDYIYPNFINSLKVIFYNEQLYYVYFVVLALVIWAAVKNRSLKYAILLPVAAIIYILIFTISHKDLAFYLFAVLFLVGLTAFFIRRSEYFNLRQERFIKLTILFCLFYVCFSCVNFFEGRYIFPAMFLITMVILPILYDYLIVKINIKIFVPVLVAVMVAGGLAFVPYGDKKLTFDRMKVHQEVVDYFETNNLYDKHIFTSSFLDKEHLREPRTGYLRSDKAFKNLTLEPAPNSEYLVFGNIYGWALYDSLKNDTNYSKVARFEHGGAWTEIYKRK